MKELSRDEVLDALYENSGDSGGGVNVSNILLTLGLEETDAYCLELIGMLERLYPEYVTKTTHRAIEVKPKVAIDYRRREEGKRNRHDLFVRIVFLIAGAALGVAGTVIVAWLMKP